MIKTNEISTILGLRIENGNKTTEVQPIFKITIEHDNKTNKISSIVKLKKNKMIIKHTKYEQFLT